MTNPDPFQSPEHLQIATAFLAGFQHEWQQGKRVLDRMEAEVARVFAANFDEAFSRWMEKQTREEHDAKRFLSCMAVGVAAAVQIAQVQQSPDS